jgi:iron complex transport system permease protein
MKNTIRMMLLLTGLAVLTTVVSIGSGDVFIHPRDTLMTLIGLGQPDHEMLIWMLRMPRLMIAILAGASLAVSGAILQAVIRNPLAAPDVVGITGGASAASVLFIVLAPAALSIHWLPLASMFGAIVAAALVYVLAWKKGASSNRLVLVGIGIASFMSACTTFLIIQSPMHTASQAYIWLTGTVYGSNWANVWTLLPWTGAFLVLAMLSVRHVNILQLGDEAAAGAGSRVQRSRLLLILLCVALAGSAVSMCGAIGFVGLIAPHMARRLAGPMLGRVIPTAAFIGAIMVSAADLVARTAFLPLDIPVGVLTSGIGAPFFLYLLFRTHNQR